MIVLAGAGAGYQAIAGYRDRKAYPPPGQLIDVDGYRMHLYCIGQGSPTVVLDSGLSDAWIHWYKVQPRIAGTTRVCAYDRAGLGWSEPRSRPRTSRVLAEELHTLLGRAGIAPPLILVGHSMGGLNVRMYTSLYPADVAGIVLVDASHPDQFDRLPPEMRSGSDPWRRAMERQALLMPFGIPRLFGWCGTALNDRAPAFRAFDCTTRQKRGTIAEIQSFQESLAQVRATGSLGDRPLVVLSEDPKDPDARTQIYLKVWGPLQEEVALLSSRGSHVVATGSGHQIHQDRPDLVIAAIQQVVAAARLSKN